MLKSEFKIDPYLECIYCHSQSEWELNGLLRIRGKAFEAVTINMVHL